MIVPHAYTCTQYGTYNMTTACVYSHTHKIIKSAYAYFYVVVLADVEDNVNVDPPQSKNH